MAMTAKGKVNGSPVQYPFLIICFFFTITIVVLKADMSQAEEAAITLRFDLTHHDSPSSLFYDRNATSFERTKRAIVAADTRLGHLIYWRKGRRVERDSVIGPGAYYVKVTIGTPPSSQILLFMDTTSPLTWTQCFPCDQCYDYQIPIFDPYNSQTYTTVACRTNFCFDLPELRSGCYHRNCTCNYDYSMEFEDQDCHCNYGFVDGNRTLSGGVLGTETFTFHADNNGDPYVFTDIAFGCTHRNQIAGTREAAGILGLRHKNSLSIISQLANQSRSSYIKQKFSYCLMGQTEDKSATSRLVLGAFVGAKTMPLQVVAGKYRVHLKDISVGSSRLNLLPGTVETYVDNTGEDGWMTIDTAGAITYLQKEEYFIFVKELERQLNLTHRSLHVDVIASWNYLSCYNGSLDRIMGAYKGVTFHFAGDLDMHLNPENLFLQLDGLFCLAVLPSITWHSSVLGNLAQQFHSVGYDLERNLVSIARVESCANF